MKALGIELAKLAGKHLWLTAGLVLGFELLWMIAATSISLTRELEALRQMGYVIGQTSQIHAIFLPVLIAVIASRLAALEHDGEMMPVLFAANQSRASLFGAKYQITLAIAVFASVLMAVVVSVIGALHGFPVDLPLMGMWLGGLILATPGLTAIQLMLSLLFSRQSVSLTIGIVGGLLGSFGTFVPPAVGMFIPWQHPGVLTPVRLDISSDGAIVGFPILEHFGMWVAIIAVIGIALFAVCQSLFVRRISH